MDTASRFCTRRLRSRKLASLTLILLVLPLILVSVTAPPVHAAAGDLDPTFGQGGKVITNLTENIDEVFGLAVQPDGKIIAVGEAPAGGSVALTRYNPNGSLDPTFGSGGIVITRLHGGARGFDIALQRDGKILVVGVLFYNFTSDFLLLRYNPDGSLDSTFGSGGNVTTDFFGLNDFGAALAIQPDGRIVAAGLADTIYAIGRPVFALARYNPNGSLDATFGNGGKVTTAFFGQQDEAFDVLLQPDGKVVALGLAVNNLTGYHFALARYNPDGSLDPFFGAGGKVTTSINGDGEGEALALQADGKIVAAGITSSRLTDNDFALVRYNQNGSLDSTFGSGGMVVTDFFGRENDLGDVTIQPNGKIVVAGWTRDDSNYEFALARYSSNGALDPAFGSGGKVTTKFTLDGDKANAIALQPDGKIIAAGRAGSNFGLARYNGDAVAFDLCIQDDGSGNLLQVNTTTGDYQFSNCGGLTVGGTGTITRRGGTITLQHYAADRRVMATIDTSANRATASVQLLSQGRTFGITDRNITNNTCACR